MADSEDALLAATEAVPAKARAQQRMDGIVSAVDGAREKLLGYEPPWVDPGYETMRADVDRTLRQAQLAIGKLFEDAATSSTQPAGAS